MLDIQSLLNFDGFTIDDEDEFETDTLLDTESVVIRAQYILDGATTLADAADAARAYADYLDSLVDNGYELTTPIQDDRGFATISF